MLSRTAALLSRVEEWILSLMVLQMGLSIFLQVVMRYVFHSAITWLDELVHIEVVFLTFFGASLGIKYGAHISVDALKNVAKGRAVHLLDALTHLVIAVYSAFVVSFGYHLIDLMAGRHHFTPTLRIPKHYLYVVVCVGLGLICLRSLVKTWQSLAVFRKSGSGEAMS
jgi:C4-dicarboxylate transporter, DctQ subunit